MARGWQFPDGLFSTRDHSRHRAIGLPPPLREQEASCRRETHIVRQQNATPRATAPNPVPQCRFPEQAARRDNGESGDVTWPIIFARANVEAVERAVAFCALSAFASSIDDMPNAGAIGDFPGIGFRPFEGGRSRRACQRHARAACFARVQPWSPFRTPAPGLRGRRCQRLGAMIEGCDQRQARTTIRRLGDLARPGPRGPPILPGHESEPDFMVAYSSKPPNIEDGDSALAAIARLLVSSQRGRVPPGFNQFAKRLGIDLTSMNSSKPAFCSLEPAVRGRTLWSPMP